MTEHTCVCTHAHETGEAEDNSSEKKIEDCKKVCLVGKGNRQLVKQDMLATKVQTCWKVETRGCLLVFH